MEYYSKRWAENAALEYLNAFRNPNENTSKKAINLMRERFKAITGLTHLSSQQLARKLNDQNYQLNVDENLNNIFGKRIIYKGKGISLDLDRLFIRDNIKELMKRSNLNSDLNSNLNSTKRYLLKSVTLYLPCSILSNNSEILDSPGTGDLDPLNTHLLSKYLKNTSNLFMIMGRSLKEAENLYDLLDHSSFMINLMNNPTQFKIISITYREKNNQFYTLKRFIELKETDDEISRAIYNNSFSYLKDLFISKLQNQFPDQDDVCLFFFII